MTGVRIDQLPCPGPAHEVLAEAERRGTDALRPGGTWLPAEPTILLGMADMILELRQQVAELKKP